MMSPEEFYKQLQARKFSPVYYLYGDEDFLISEAIDALIGEIMKDTNRDFNLDIFYGAESDGQEIVACANAFPMLAERRLVIVREFEYIENKDPLYSYIEKPSPTTSLVLASSKSDPKIRGAAAAVEFRRLRVYELRKWVSDRAKRCGKEMSSEVAEVLLTYVENSLQTLDREIEKASVFVGEKKTIDDVDIATVAGASKTYNVFQLTKAVGNRDLKRSLEILERMMEVGEPPVLMVAMLTKHFMALLRFAEGQRKKMSNSELASMLRAGSSRVNEFTVQLRKFSTADLENSFTSLVRADEKLKFTSEDPRSVMTVLLHELLG